MPGPAGCGAVPVSFFTSPAFSPLISFGLLSTRSTSRSPSFTSNHLLSMLAWPRSKALTLLPGGPSYVTKYLRCLPYLRRHAGEQLFRPPALYAHEVRGHVRNRLRGLLA